MTSQGTPGKREVLFAAHRIPYPPDKGDKIRSWRLLNHLASRFDVHLCAFVDDARDFTHREKLESLCKTVSLIALHPWRARLRSAAGVLTGEPLSFPFYRSPKMRAGIEEARKRDLVCEVVFSSAMAPYVAKEHGARPRFVDLCDADSEKWRQYADEASGPMKWVYAREGRKLAEAETEIINWADKAFAISPAEAEVLNHRVGIERRADWFGNGVDADYFSPDAIPAAGRAHDAVFTGAMDYQANVGAILWFAKDVWPLVRAQKPDARLAVVGANPVHAVRELGGRDGIEVTGRVDDVRPWIAGARVAVAPMKIARGVQNKVLEAMAMARAVVATPEAAEGIACVRGEEIIIASDAAAFARELAVLIDDRAARAKIGDAARARMIEDYSWAAQLSRFDVALTQAGL